VENREVFLHMNFSHAQGAAMMPVTIAICTLSCCPGMVAWGDGRPTCLPSVAGEALRQSHAQRRRTPSASPPRRLCAAASKSVLALVWVMLASCRPPAHTPR